MVIAKTVNYFWPKMKDAEKTMENIVRQQIKNNYIIPDSTERESDSLDINPYKVIAIHRLLKYNLSAPLWLIVEPDGNGIIARCVDLPLYGYGEDAIEAVNNLKFEINSLYEDLMEDDNFTEDWLKIKAFLKNNIITQNNL